MLTLPALTFVKQRYSPGQATYAVYEPGRRYPVNGHPVLGWVDVDWDDAWYVARNA